MGRYTSKDEVIIKAQALGSQARTFKGAAKFLVKKAHDPTPLEKRGNLSWGNSLKRYAESE